VAVEIWPVAMLPEIDRGAWLQRAEVLARIVRGQRPVLEKFYSDFTR